MHRRPLLDLLRRYAARHPGEAACVERVRALVENRVDCFERTCRPGHVTASCWIWCADRGRFLLTHHRKLDRWLQLGGHADGDPDVARVALREAREESGMEHFAFHGPVNHPAGPEPIDLDVHRIPAHGAEPAHEHHDVRFLLLAEPGQEVRCSSESKALQWFRDDQLDRLGADESLLRMARKARAFVAAHPEEWR